MKILKICFWVACVVSLNVHAHGIRSATSTVEIHTNNVVAFNVQFDLVRLLNHGQKTYTLTALAALKPKQFERLYQEVVKLFDAHLIVKLGKTPITVNRHYPSSDQMYNVIKKQFSESRFTAKQLSIPYTYNDRRFYQKFSYDFRLKNRKDVEELNLTFPKELGNVYVTVTESSTRDVHSNETWFVGAQLKEMHK